MRLEIHPTHPAPSQIKQTVDSLRRAAVLATVLSEDATNVFVTITAREMNPEVMIIARGEIHARRKNFWGVGPTGWCCRPRLARRKWHS